MYDNEAETRVLSSILHSDNACVEVFNTLTPDDFAEPLNKDILMVAKKIYSAGAKPTLAEVVKELSDIGRLDKETLLDINHISSSYIDDRNTEYWCQRVSHASKGRKAKQLLLRYQEVLNSDNVDIPQYITHLTNDVMALAMDADTETITSAEEVAELGLQMLRQNLDRYREQQALGATGGGALLEGVSTGIPTLDNVTFGYKPGDLIILGAQTGHGKTSFALNTAKAVCVDGNKPLLYVNTEMSPKQVAYRFGAMLSQQEVHKIRSGSLSNGEVYQVETSYKLLAKSNFHTSYLPNLTPEKLSMIAKKAKMQHGIEMLILDYVGRMDKIDPKLQEWQVLEQIVKSQKLLAQNLEIAVMILVQLNEDGGLQGAKRMKNECDLMLKFIPMCTSKDEQEIQQAQRRFEQKYGGCYEMFNYRLWIDKSRDSRDGFSIPIDFDQERQQIREARSIERKR